MGRTWFLGAVLAATTLAGCGTGALLDGLPPNYFSEGNYLTFADHAFTDATIEAVRKRAEAHCASVMRAAIRTSGSCSLSRCTTHYQCVSPADAAAFKSADPKK